MSRKVMRYTVEDEGRDKGKVFVITEMSADQGESWAIRVLLALMASNAEIPDDFAELGIAGLAQLGIRSLTSLKWDVAKPLLAEMFSTVTMNPSPGVNRELIDQDIEEIMTRLKLRFEIWKLNMGFLNAVAPLISVPKTAGNPNEDQQPIKTFQG